MHFRRCEAGEHSYDDSQHSSCPYCRKTHFTTPPGGGSNDIPSGSSPKSEIPPGREKTTPAHGMNMDSGIPPKQSNNSTETHVVFGGGAGKADDFGEVMPVVAWLVVVDGKGQGNDLRITPGMNSIGRETGDILLNFGEASVSRNKHAYIAYDPDENTFMIAHGEGKNLTKINGKMVMGTQELKPYDRIHIGKTALMFVPLCGEHFSWASDDDHEEESKQKTT